MLDPSLNFHAAFSLTCILCSLVFCGSVWSVLRWHQPRMHRFVFVYHIKKLQRRKKVCSFTTCDKVTEEWRLPLGTLFIFLSPAHGLEKHSAHWWGYHDKSEQRLAQSAATHTANTLQLPLSSFPGAAWEEGGEWIFSVWDAGTISHCSLPPVLDLVSTGGTDSRLPSTAFLFVCLPPVFSIFKQKQKHFPPVAVLFYLWCFAAEVKDVHRRPVRALMGGSFDSGWDWGCWTEGGRACLSWDSSSSSRGSTRPPSTASSAVFWDWPMYRASPLCPTACTRWAGWERDTYKYSFLHAG